MILISHKISLYHLVAYLYERDINMTALTLKLTFAALVGLGMCFLAMGIYANDHIYLVIGALLECAAALVDRKSVV